MVAVGLNAKRTTAESPSGAARSRADLVCLPKPTETIASAPCVAQGTSISSRMRSTRSDAASPGWTSSRLKARRPWAPDARGRLADPVPTAHGRRGSNRRAEGTELPRGPCRQPARSRARGEATVGAERRIATGFLPGPEGRSSVAWRRPTNARRAFISHTSRLIGRAMAILHEHPVRGRTPRAALPQQRICEPRRGLGWPPGKMRRRWLRDAIQEDAAELVQALASRTRSRNVSRLSSLVGPQGPAGLNVRSARR